MRKKISISIDEQLITKLETDAKQKNLSLSRLIENKLQGIE
jgi:predicted HicB family RNase H-like nuclease